MEERYREIQPALRAEAGEIDRKVSVSRKRQPVRIACNPCREKKRACNGIEPICVDSTIRIQKQLDTLQHKFNHYADIVEQLKTLPEADALRLLQRLRSPADVHGTFSSLQGSEHTRMRLSDHRTAQAILPTTNSRIEFELTALHGIVYPTLEPIDIASLPISPLEKPTPLLSQTVDSGTLVQRIPPASPIELVSARVRPLCDSRLEEIEISYWTKVPISNESAAAMISRFLETDQTIFGFVDANLFVKGLVERKPQFCSAFLVCSMLYLVCHAYTALDLKSVAVGRLFFREAERIFQAERSSDELVTLAAINIFSLATFVHGNDKMGKELLSSARHMGRRLGLYGQPLDSPSSLAFQELPDDLVRMTAHVAWSTYNWLTIHVLYYHDESIAIPPSLPIPGDGRHADLWPEHPLPAYMGLSFTRLCQFFTMIQEVAVVYSIADATPIVDRVPIAFAEAKYQKVLAWADSLGKDMIWDQNSQEHVMLFHMWFHCAVLDIFRPFAQVHQSYKLQSFSSPDSTPQTIFSASLNQLKRLALLYRTRQMPNSYMPHINTSLMHIANTICKETNDPTSKFYFLLCIRYWQHLYIGYPIFGEIAQAFLTMAMNNGLITNREAKGLMAEVKEQGRHHELSHVGISTTLIVDFDLAMTNRGKADVQAVAQKFEEVALFDEFAVYKNED
ncbi:uncharacterized protein FFFS_04730 [Fusarium fujikuroi]|nr:uncharacterized protein FFFS_04730 [Fusarium fujikuroi]